MNPLLEVKNLTKHYQGTSGSGTLVLDKINFSIMEEDNITSLLVPFGGGKSTLLKILAGLDFNFDGILLLKGNKIGSKLPYIPEKPSSFPWLNVEGNIKLVFSLLESLGRSPAYKLQELIDKTGLTGYEDHYPNNRSYGFRFRISLARALAVSPDIILLDEPFKIMDDETKKEIFDLIRKITIETGVKFLFATSNITESVLLSDKIYIMKKNPGSITGDIKTGKNTKGTTQLKEEILNILQKEITINIANFSI